MAGALRIPEIIPAHSHDARTDAPVGLETCGTGGSEQEKLLNNGVFFDRIRG
jgi:hypothetical protein